ncbi:MAG: adenylosuccinate lyase [Candidatus Micrarchaeota archaeon]|nr:adenylosuccinate lyase [Candidatus Micrarchaeota archaeon]
MVGAGGAAGEGKSAGSSGSGNYGFDSYLSPFTWRYGSKEMRFLFSETNRRLAWRRIWVALAEAEQEAGLVSQAEARDIAAHAKQIDIPKALEVEKEIRHDVMAEIKVFSAQCPAGGGKIHLGATSMDIVDNADALIVKQALGLARARLAALLKALGEKITEYKAVPCMGFTHLQPAEPVTVGYRFAVYAQDFLECLDDIEKIERNLKGKGIKGAVGTSASYSKLLKGKKFGPVELERKVMSKLGLPAFTVSNQTYPRQQDYAVAAALARAAACLHKMAFDFRVLQSPPFGEVMEPFKETQVGSSAMPFKRNPISCERICSLARLVAAAPSVAWENAADTLLERTLDDSANRRIYVPEAFLALEESLLLAEKVVKGLRVNKERVGKNLGEYGPFSSTEALLMRLVEKGMGRQDAHELIRIHSMKAWEEVVKGGKNRLREMLAADRKISKLVPAKEFTGLFDAAAHVGNAVEKCGEMAEAVGKKTAAYAAVESGGEGF